MGSYSPQQIGKTLLEPLRIELLGGALTKINVEQGRVGTFHQDLLGGTMQGLIHEVDTISNHGSDPLSKALKEQCKLVRPQSPQELAAVSAWDFWAPPRSAPPPHASPVPGPVYLEPFELTFHIYFQGGEHGLVLVGQVLESVQVTLTVTL